MTAASTPIMAWMFGQVIEVFQYFQVDMDKMWEGAKFWSLMWFMLSIGVGISYLLSGWSASRLSCVGLHIIRHNHLGPCFCDMSKLY